MVSNVSNHACHSEEQCDEESAFVFAVRCYDKSNAQKQIFRLRLKMTETENNGDGKV